MHEKDIERFSTSSHFIGKQQPQDTEDHVEDHESIRSQSGGTTHWQQGAWTLNVSQPVIKEIIPLISSGTMGPLGVKHLPRLWLKTVLSATGHLPEGYKDIRPGFDYMVLEGLGIDPDSARAFIIGNCPTYLAFEKWVCEQPNADISAANISKINESIESRTKSPEIRMRMLTENGLPEDSPIESSVMLNNLDDWKSIHAQVTE